MIDHPDSDSPVEPPDDSETLEEQSNSPVSRGADGDPEATFVGPFSVDIPGKGTDETFVEDIQDRIREEDDDAESDRTLIVDDVLEDFEPPGDSETLEEQSNSPASRDTDDDPEATFVGPYSVDIPGKGTEETFVEGIQDAIREEENDVESDKTMVIDGVLEDFADSLAVEHQDLDRTLPHTSLKPQQNDHEDWMESLESFPQANSVSRRSVQSAETTEDEVQLPVSSGEDNLDYVTLSMLGEGGMGTVHLARQIALGRDVALKTIHRHSSGKQSVRDEFLTEAVLTGRLEHPNIVPIHEVGESPDGDLFYSMKNVKGQSWDETIDGLSLNENLEILIDVCNAMAFAHTEGVIHRDLKPQNIMTGGFGEVLVLDWGLAVLVGPGQSANASAGGTPSFMAPEMINPPFLVGPHSDVYLLGAILFRLLTGQPPHDGKSARDCLKAVSRNEIVVPESERIRENDPTGELLGIAMKAMATEPEERYQTVGEFRQAVRVFEAHQESLKLASHAEEALEAAEQSEDYTKYSEAVFGFGQAVTLWDGNEPAKEAAERARLAYAKCAELKEDFELGLSLLEQSRSEHPDLVQRLTAARNERDSRQARLRRMKRGLLAAAALMFAIVSGAAFWINQERIEVNRQRGIAVSERQNAEEARGVAEDARDDLNDTLTRSFFLTAKEHLESGDQANGLAYLARALRTDAEYWPAANRITSVLSDHNHYTDEPFRINMKEPIAEAGLDRHTKTFYWTMTQGRRGMLWDVKNRKKIGVIAGGQRIDRPWFTRDASLLFVSLRDRGGSIQGFRTTDGKQATKLIPIENRVNRPFYVHEPRKGVRRITAGNFNNGTFNLWDAVSGKTIGAELTASEESAMVDLDVSSNDRFIGTTYADGTLALWSSEDGKLVYQTKVPGGPVYFSGGRRNYMVVTATSGRMFGWVDVSAESIEVKTQETEYLIDDVGMHSHFPQLYVAGGKGKDSHTRVVDLSTGKETCRFVLEGYVVDGKNPFVGRPRFGGRDGEGVAFSEPWLGTYITGQGADCRDFWTGKSISTLDFRGNVLTSAMIPADGLRLISKHADRSVRIWDLIEGKLMVPPIEHSLKPIMDVTEDGERLFTATVDGMQVKMWSTRTGKLLQEAHAFSKAIPETFFMLNDRSAVLQFNKTLRGVGAGQKLQQGESRVWEMTRGRRRFPTFQTIGGIRSVDFSPDGRWIAIQNHFDTAPMAKILDAKTLEEVRSFQLPEIGQSTVFSPDGKSLAVGSRDGFVRFWDLETGELTGTLAAGQFVRKVRYLPDGKRMVVQSGFGTITVFDVESGYRIHPDWNLGVNRFDLSVDGRKLAVGSSGGNSYLIDVESGELQKLLPSAVSGVEDIHFNSDGTRVVVAVFGGKSRVWDTTSTKLVFETPAIDSYSSAAFHPNGTVLALAASPMFKLTWGKVELWDVVKGTQVSDPLMSKGQALAGRMRFSHSGRLLALGNSRSDVTVWEFPTGATLLESSTGAPASTIIQSVEFSPDDRRLAVTSFENSTKFGKLTMIGLPPMEGAAPMWLAELAEVVANRRIDENGDSVSVTQSGMEAIRKTVAASDDNDPYGHWGRWFLDLPDQRTSSPWGEKRAAENMAKLLRARDLPSLHRVLEFAPDSGLAHARIGYAMATSERTNTLESHVVRHWLETAGWHSEQAIALEPDNAEIWAVRALVMQRGGRFDEMDKAVDEALKRDEDHIFSQYVHALSLQHRGEKEKAYAAFQRAFGKLPEPRKQSDWPQGRPFLPGILDTVMQQPGRVPVDLAAAGQLRLSETTAPLEIRQAEVDWLTRLAVELFPKDPGVRLARANVLMLAGQTAEAIKTLGQDGGGEVDPLLVGEVVRNAAVRLVEQKEYKQAHQLLLNAGIPARSPEASARQIDLSKYYNQSLFDVPFRTRKKMESNRRFWNRLPVGLARLNGVQFDVRGIVRLKGGDHAADSLVVTPPTKVEKIPINQKATWIHVLHNCSFNDDVRWGEFLGRYMLHYEDGSEKPLYINYGLHLVTWVNNPFAVPMYADFGWREGAFDETRTLTHCVWENPEPDKTIASVTFESTENRASPFLVAMTLELPEPLDGDRDALSLINEARRKIDVVNGATDTTHNHVAKLLKKAAPAAKAHEDTNFLLRFVQANLHAAKENHVETLKTLDGLTSPQPSMQNSLHKLRAYGYYLAEDYDKAAKEMGLSVRQEDFRAGMPSGLDHHMTQGLLAYHMSVHGVTKGRDFVLKSQIPPRSADTPGETIDLTSKYNAGLHEAWHIESASSAQVATPLCRTLKTGVHRFRGIPFDVRGVVNLSAGLETEIPFPASVQEIVVGKKADSLHFLHSGYKRTTPGTIVAIYRIVYADGEVEEFPIRFGFEMHHCWIPGIMDSPWNLVWRGEGATGDSLRSDAALYLATWDNPRPDQEIAHVDFTATLNKVNPFLVALTTDRHADTLAADTNSPLDLVSRAVHRSRRARDNKQLQEQAISLAEKAVERAPKNAEVWRLRAEMFLVLGEAAEAARSIARASALDPDSGQVLFTQERVHVLQGDTKQALLARGQARQKTLRWLIPPRDTTLSVEQLDLESHYNVALSEDLYKEASRNPWGDDGLTALPAGKSVFNGVTFDVRGVIALHGQKTRLRVTIADVVDRVERVDVGRKADSIHLLHGVAFSSRLPYGTVVSNYRVHFADGTEELVPVRIGEHVLDWWLPRSRKVAAAKLAFTIRSKRSADRDLGCYHMTWVNPKPGVVITRIDFETTDTDASPFLLGITLGSGSAAVSKF